MQPAFKTCFGISLKCQRRMSCALSIIPTLPGCENSLFLKLLPFSRCLPAAARYNPISIDDFDTQVYSIFESGAHSIAEDPVFPHKLSLMFIVLAIGSLMNTSLPAYSLEAEKYHQLARAALFHTSIFDAPTIHAVQALVRLLLK